VFTEPGFDCTPLVGDSITSDDRISHPGEGDWANSRGFSVRHGYTVLEPFVVYKNVNDNRMKLIVDI